MTVLNTYSVFAIMAGLLAMPFVPWKYLLARLRGTAKLESRKNTACVVVGMEKSSKYGACPGAGVDSDRMAQLLSKYGSVRKLTNGSATSATVTAALMDAVKKPLCIFYYSGHGGQASNPKASDGTGKSEFLALDRGPLYDYTIWNVISKSRGRVVVIFDCCHSGTMFRSAGAGESGSADEGTGPNLSGFRFGLLETVLVSNSSSSFGLLSWAGCPADSVSYGDASGGVFTNGILRSYSARKTYDKVFEGARNSSAGSQKLVRTVIGTGFKGRVFR